MLNFPPVLNRAELPTDSEATPVRTMQFVIERQCPLAVERYPELHNKEAGGIPLGGFPVVVWVDLPALTPTLIAMAPIQCGAQIWFHLNCTLNPGIRFNLRGYRASVCQHMGHLIE